MPTDNTLPERFDVIHVFKNDFDFLQKLEDLPKDRIMAVMFIGEDFSALSDVGLRFVCLAEHEKAKAIMDFYVIHLERQHDLACRLGVRSAPYFTWFRNGSLQATLDGDSEQDLVRMTACFTHGNGIESIQKEFAGRQLDHNPLKANLDIDWLDMEGTDEEQEDIIETAYEGEEVEVDSEDDEDTDEGKNASVSSSFLTYNMKLAAAVDCRSTHVVRLRTGGCGSLSDLVTSHIQHPESAKCH